MFEEKNTKTNLPAQIEPAFAGWLPLPAQICDGLALLASVGRRRALWTGVGAGQLLAERQNMLRFPPNYLHR
jgi:hypothetical protein